MMIESINALPVYKLVRTEDNGERMHATPVENVPLITTVLSGTRDDSRLAAWRESVGETRAGFISGLLCF